MATEEASDTLFIAFRFAEVDAEITVHTDGLTCLNTSEGDKLVVSLLSKSTLAVVHVGTSDPVRP